MYLTTLFGFLTLMSAVLGFLDLGFGTVPPMRVVFFVLLAVTVISFFLEWRKKDKKYYD